MVVKIYVSGISGNKEVKKKQQRVQMILDSKSVTYEAIDITEPGREKEKEYMQQNSKVREVLGKHPLPPQIFNEGDYCGDYEDFDLANETDELEAFLHIPIPSKLSSPDNTNDEKINGSREADGDGRNPSEATTTKENGVAVELTSLSEEGNATTEDAQEGETADVPQPAINDDNETLANDNDDNETPANANENETTPAEPQDEPEAEADSEGEASDEAEPDTETIVQTQESLSDAKEASNRETAFTESVAEERGDNFGRINSPIKHIEKTINSPNIKPNTSLSEFVGDSVDTEILVESQVPNKVLVGDAAVLDTAVKNIETLVTSPCEDNLNKALSDSKALESTESSFVGLSAAIDKSVLSGSTLVDTEITKESIRKSFEAVSEVVQKNIGETDNVVESKRGEVKQVLSSSTLVDAEITKESIRKSFEAVSDIAQKNIGDTDNVIESKRGEIKQVQASAESNTAIAITERSVLSDLTSSSEIKGGVVKKNTEAGIDSALKRTEQTGDSNNSKAPASTDSNIVEPQLGHTRLLTESNELDTSLTKPQEQEPFGYVDVLQTENISSELATNVDLNSLTSSTRIPADVSPNSSVALESGTGISGKSKFNAVTNASGTGVTDEIKKAVEDSSLSENIDECFTTSAKSEANKEADTSITHQVQGKRETSSLSKNIDGNLVTSLVNSEIDTIAKIKEESSEEMSGKVEFHYKTSYSPASPLLAFDRSDKTESVVDLVSPNAENAAVTMSSTKSILKSELTDKTTSTVNKSANKNSGASSEDIGNNGTNETVGDRYDKDVSNESVANASIKNDTILSITNPKIQKNSENNWPIEDITQNARDSICTATIRASDNSSISLVDSNTTEEGKYTSRSQVNNRSGANTCLDTVNEDSSLEKHDGVPNLELLDEAKPSIFDIDKISFTPQLQHAIIQSPDDEEEKGIFVKSWNRRASEADLVKHVRTLLTVRDAKVASRIGRDTRSPDPHSEFLNQINCLISDVEIEEDEVSWPVVTSPREPTPPPVVPPKPVHPQSAFILEVLRVLNSPAPTKKVGKEVKQKSLFLNDVKTILDSEEQSFECRTVYFVKERAGNKDNSFVEKVRVLLDEKEKEFTDLDAVNQPYQEVLVEKDHSQFLNDVFVMLNDQPMTEEAMQQVGELHAADEEEDDEDGYYEDDVEKVTEIIKESKTEKEPITFKNLREEKEITVKSETIEEVATVVVKTNLESQKHELEEKTQSKSILTEKAENKAAPKVAPEVDIDLGTLQFVNANGKRTAMPLVITSNRKDYKLLVKFSNTEPLKIDSETDIANVVALDADSEEKIVATVIVTPSKKS